MAGRTGFSDVVTKRQILLDSNSGDRDNEDLIILEQSFSGELRYLTEFLDSEKSEENQLREKIWQLAELDDYSHFNVRISIERLETLYTPEAFISLDPLLIRLRDHINRKVTERYFRLLEMKYYLAFLLSLLAISIGTSFISFEMVRRKTA